MLRVKSDLILRQEFYDELIAVTETIQVDDNNLFSDELFRHLEIAVKKLQRFGEKCGCCVKVWYMYGKPTNR